MPCGMVYLALMTAAWSGGALGGASYMAAFAVGTMPGVSAAALQLHRLGFGGRRHLRTVMGWVILMLAVSQAVFTAQLFPGLCGDHAWSLPFFGRGS